MPRLTVGDRQTGSFGTTERNGQRLVLNATLPCTTRCHHCQLIPLSAAAWTSTRSCRACLAFGFCLRVGGRASGFSSMGLGPGAVNAADRSGPAEAGHVKGRAAWWYYRRLGRPSGRGSFPRPEVRQDRCCWSYRIVPFRPFGKKPPPVKPPS